MRFCFFYIFRYHVIDFAGGSLLRIEPVRRKPDLSEIECRAENGAGDPVYAQATLTVYDGKNAFSLFLNQTVYNALGTLSFNFG